MSGIAIKAVITFQVTRSGQAKRDPESSSVNEFWIPAFAGMTTERYCDTVSKGGEITVSSINNLVRSSG